jgi:hypothetical protein
MSPVVLSVLATAVAIAAILSIILFSIEVFVKGREVYGQVLGLTLSLLGFIIFTVTFADVLPGRPTGIRRLLSLLPGVEEGDLNFSSPIWALVALVVIYALRGWIYYRLFIVPAITLDDVEYRSPEQIEQRANDYTAPVLAFIVLAIAASALLETVYDLPIGWVPPILIGLVCIYLSPRLFRPIRRFLKQAAVAIRVGARNLKIWASRFIVLVIVLLGWVERWRTQLQPSDADLDYRLKIRLQRTILKAQAANTKDMAYLRGLVSEREG